MTKVVAMLYLAVSSSVAVAGVLDIVASHCRDLLTAPPTRVQSDDALRVKVHPARLWLDGVRTEFTAERGDVVATLRRRPASLTLRFRDSETPGLDRDLRFDPHGARRNRVAFEGPADDAAQVVLTYHVLRQRNGRSLVNVWSTPASGDVLEPLFRGLDAFTRAPATSLTVHIPARGEKLIDQRAKRGVNFEITKGRHATEQVLSTGGAFTEIGETTINGSAHRLSFVLDADGEILDIDWP